MNPRPEDIVQISPFYGKQEVAIKKVKLIGIMVLVCALGAVIVP